MADRSYEHQPVMLREVLRLFEPMGGGEFLDLTLGGGGHTRGILDLHPGNRVLGVDRDQDTLRGTAARLEGYGPRFRGLWSRFDRAQDAEGGFGETQFDGVLADLGMSSIQVDDPERGFRFVGDAPLDMRMDRSEGETAADVLARRSERELADLLFRFGDEPRSRALARRIAERRRAAPFRRTQDLVDVIEDVLGPSRPGRIHPATRTFQALRMEVNDEWGSLQGFLERVGDWLRPGGVVVVIAFHSGEDRLVKRAFRDMARGGLVETLTPKPLRPQEDEVASNRRARSARLRAARRTGEPAARDARQD